MKLMLNCMKATRLMSEALERELALTESLLLRFHVMMCTGCRNFRDQTGSLRRIARAYAQGQDERAADATGGERPPRHAKGATSGGGASAHRTAV